MKEKAKGTKQEVSSEQKRQTSPDRNTNDPDRHRFQIRAIHIGFSLPPVTCHFAAVTPGRCDTFCKGVGIDREA
jgi:hypothetical protein